VEGKGEWLRRRKGAGNPPARAVYGHRRVGSGVLIHPQRWPGGSSGLYGIDVALGALNADRVVGCGIPMDERPNLFRGEGWVHAGSHQHMFHKAKRQVGERLRFMSGWSRDLFGEPTPEWLSGL